MTPKRLKKELKSFKLRIVVIELAGFRIQNGSLLHMRVNSKYSMY